jgi:hypothetical protein
MFSVSASLALTQSRFGNAWRSHPLGSDGYAFSLSSPERKGVSEPQKHTGKQVARGGVRLLKFCVCWDAAVCPISAGGFFSV